MGLLRSGLVEVLVVMTLLGMLSAIVVAGVIGMKERVTRFACDADVSTIALAADTYYAKHLAYPPDAESLTFEGYLRPGSGDGYAVTYLRSTDGRGYTVSGQTTSGHPCRTAKTG